jgi:hypothetical protein
LQKDQEEEELLVPGLASHKVEGNQEVDHKAEGDQEVEVNKEEVMECRRKLELMYCIYQTCCFYHILISNDKCIRHTLFNSQVGQLEIAVHICSELNIFS